MPGGTGGSLAGDRVDPGSPSRLRRAGTSLRGVLARHPVLLLLLLSPGIPEYLSTSSPIDALVLSPGTFVFELVANLGLYGPGVLLVREAMVRGQRSWPSLVAFGAAYATLEEGVALSTMTNPMSATAGALGAYGHLAGVSWVWSLGVAMVHTVFSLALPILLLGLALPDTRGRPLLSRRQIALAFVILGADVGVLAVAVDSFQRFSPGLPLLLGLFGAIGACVVVGIVAPGARVFASARPSTDRWLRIAAWGGLLLPGTFLVQAIPRGAGAPAIVTFVLLAIFYIVWIAVALRFVGTPARDPHLLALAIGLLASIIGVGFIASFALPLVVALDLVAVAFLRHLVRRVGLPGRSDAPPSPVALAA